MKPNILIDQSVENSAVFCVSSNSVVVEVRDALRATCEKRPIIFLPRGTHDRKDEFDFPIVYQMSITAI